MPLDDGQPLTRDRYAAIRDDELRLLRAATPDAPWDEAVRLLDGLVLADNFPEFLTIPAYPTLG